MAAKAPAAFGRNAGSFRVHRGRCEIYVRDNYTTLFFQSDDGAVGAYHLRPDDAYEAGRALLAAGDSKPAEGGSSDGGQV